MWQRIEARPREIRKASQSHAFDWPMPGEGESGCIFDEIQDLVEPIERSARGESHATNANTRSIGRSVSGAGKRSEGAELGRLAKDGVMSPEQPGQTRMPHQPDFNFSSAYSDSSIMRSSS